jgi:hypothetical protein
MKLLLMCECAWRDMRQVARHIMSSGAIIRYTSSARKPMAADCDARTRVRSQGL